MADVYDDDEENPPVYFEQDPDSDDIGEGYWTRKDGSRVYGKGDANEAKALTQQGSAGVEGGPQRVPMAPADPASADEQFLSSTTGAEAEDQALGGASPEPAEPAPAPGQPALAQPGAGPAEANESPKPLQPLSAPALPGARGPARYTDNAAASASRSASQNNQQSEARTGSAQDRTEFEQQQGDLARGYEHQGTAVEQGAKSQSDAILQRRSEIMRMAQDKEAATTAAMAQRDARAKQVTTKIGEVSSRKTDHNKIWKDKGALGTTLGLLGVALRSLTATKFGGPNTALQSIQEQKKQNLQAQMEDRDSELRGLEKEFGSLEAAVPVFEARMNDVLSKRIDAMMLDEKSATVLANGKAMKAQLETEKVGKLKEAAAAYAGTIATQQSQGTQQSATEGQEMGRSRLSGAGVGEQAKGKSPQELYADLLELDKKEEERGIPKEDRARKWQAYGFQPPRGESAPEMTNREQKEKVARDEENLSEDQAKAESAMVTIEGYGSAADLKRDPKTGKWVEPGGFTGTIKPGWSEGATGLVGQSAPVGDARDAAGEALGRLASGGVITKEEEERFRKMLGEASTRNQLASKLNTIETLVNTRRKEKFRNTPRGAPASWKSKPTEETQP